MADGYRDAGRMGPAWVAHQAILRNYALAAALAEYRRVVHHPSTGEERPCR